MSKPVTPLIPGVVYARVSTTEQEEENQLPAVEALAAAHGIRVVEVIREKKSTRKVRPGFERVLSLARDGKVRAVLVWALDRFGRSMLGNLQAVLELDELGVRVLSHREPWLATLDPATRRLMVGIVSWIAEWERDQRGERTKAGLARAKRQGIRLGRPRRDVNVQTARNMKAPGVTWAQIARKLGVSRPTLLRKVRAAQAA